MLHDFLGKVQEIQGPMYSWAWKLDEATYQIREKIEIVHITIVFVDVLVGFVIAVVLAHVTCNGRLPRNGRFPFEQLKPVIGK